MKNKFKLIVIIAAFFCVGVSAQAPKIAHINMQELVFAMPEYEEAMESLTRFAQDLENTLEELQVERSRKIDEFQRLSETWSDLVRQTRAEEIQSMSQRIQMFEQRAHSDVMQEQERLLQPIIEKAQAAIEVVAKEQDITYVISSDPQILVYKAANTIDLLPAVKRHMGIRE